MNLCYLDPLQENKMPFPLAFVFLLSGIQYPLIDALPRATTVYIGSDSVFIEDKTIYYCPDEPNVLIFQCHVHNSNIMEWRVSNNTANNTIRFAASADVEKIARDGYISAFLNNEVQNNPDHSKNNFTSIMYLDTKDLVGHNITTVSCRTSDSKHFDKHYLIPLDGNLSTFNNFSASLEQRSAFAIAYLEWDYPGNRSYIRGYRTVIYDETEVFHNKTLGPDIKDTSCKLPSRNTYNASIETLSRCTRHIPVMEIRNMKQGEEGTVNCSMQEIREDSSEGSSTPLAVGLTVGLAAVLVLCFLTPDITFSENKRRHCRVSTTSKAQPTSTHTNTTARLHRLLYAW